MKYQTLKSLLNKLFFYNKNGTDKKFVPFFLTLLLVCCSFYTKAQTKKNERLLQLSGKVVVLEVDSLKGLPFASVLIRKKKEGAVTNGQGFFTLVASPGDVIEFISIGYKDAQYIIPDTLTTKHFTITQAMKRDTITLGEVAVYPWPSKEDFKSAFLKLNVPNDDLSRAQKNMAAEQMRELVNGIAMDGGDNYRYSMEQRYQKLSYIGQYPPNQLLNPFAWAKFIQALKAGKLKRK
jgi:hypothetical protein